MSAPQPTGSLETALAHATRLLETRPTLAEAQAREILSVAKGHPGGLRLLGLALRAQGRFAEAIDPLKMVAEAQPQFARAQLELAMAFSDAGQCQQAITAFRQTVRIEPQHPAAWRALGDELMLAGDNKAADVAYARHIKASTTNPRLLEAAAALCENKLAIAERLLREFLKQNPTDVAAIRMLAETGARLGRLDDAEALLARCLELAPGFVEARHNYAIILHRQNKLGEAMGEVDTLLARDARNPRYRGLKAVVLARTGDYEGAIAAYRSLLRELPNQPKAWMSYGHALKTVGRTDEAVAAYRKSIALLPSLGEAYWSLANLKTFRFAAEEVKCMRAQLGRADLEEEDRIHLHFALGKALEDAQDYEYSFSQYEAGNALRRAHLRYDPHEISQLVGRSKRLFTRSFFAERRGAGNPAPDPIFIVGLTRAGSTLLEQILASHSQVEGTMELPDIIALARRFGRKSTKGVGVPYPDSLCELVHEEFWTLGEEYLSRTRVQRKTARPFFVDKMPNNWGNVGFIHLILPNAKIIDARRHPLACCFSNFKQLFARGQGFSYSLGDCGQYYRDYVDLMAHYDAVLPGRIHRVIYEQMVENPEREIRRLLGYCGLEFEDQCLRFYENERAVRTASSEQVRQPISTAGLEQWRHFEPWLGELKAALGPVVESYPVAPPT
ncbi:MAG: sulfotransferase [Alphaproteobacteria bacterium]|nr:sulfotransferase [Alphaproteobacteria bacterium]MBV9063163.1 sulfotransferase [Alphaproteobacteria bacterium]